MSTHQLSMSCIATVSTLATIVFVMEGRSNMQVEKCQELGTIAEYHSGTKEVFDTIETLLAEYHIVEIEVRCIAYCVKTKLAPLPCTLEESLLVVKDAADDRQFLVLLERSCEEGWRKMRSPTHNVSVTSVIEAQELNASAIENFLESSTFGFYDYSIASQEKLYLSAGFLRYLRFLQSPISDAKRISRMSQFVAPGP